MNKYWKRGCTALIVLAVAACGGGASELDQATAFWEAVEAGDRDTAMSYIDPVAVESAAATTFGRASTQEGQFDWYEAVGWKWTLDECVEGGEGEVHCRTAARNAWSDALGVEPVKGTFTLIFGEDGIVEIVDETESFISLWAPLVFQVFANWVEANHPADAAIMWSDRDVDQEILDLYEVNTERFVAAQEGG